MTRSSTGLLLIGAGAVVILLGILVWAGALSWFGRLPGDLRVERPGLRLYVPITTMILVSIALSIALAILRRLR